MTKGRDVVLSGAILAAETLSAIGLPGASVVDKAVSAAVERRAQEARELLFEAIKQEGVDGVMESGKDLDEYLQMMMRYAKCANEGAARQNLKLLAQVIAGLKKNRTLDYDKFQSCAVILESLNRDEILFVGKFRTWLESTGGDIRWPDFKQKTNTEIPDLDVDACAASLARTGMILPVSAYGGMIYVPTLRMNEICELAKLEDALN